MSDGLCEAIMDAFGLPIFRERVRAMRSSAAGILAAKNLGGWAIHAPPSPNRQRSRCRFFASKRRT